MNYRKISFILLSIFYILTLSGCWDRTEPENLAIVTGLGVDYNPETKLYKIVIQIVNPLVMKASGGGGGAGNKPAFWAVSAQGLTAYDALLNISKKVSLKISYSQTQLLIFSEEMARKGVLPVIDANERTKATRPIMVMAVAKGDVEKVLSVEIPIEQSNALGLLRQIKLTHKEVGGTTAENAKTFFCKLSQPGIHPVAVLVSLINQPDQKKGGEQGSAGGDQSKGGSEGQGSSADTPPQVMLTGKAIFFRDRMVGEFTNRETRGCNWILNELNRAVLTTIYPGNPDIRATVLITKASSNFQPTLAGGKPGIKLTVRAEGRIEEIDGLNELKDENQITISLERRIAEVIRNDIKLALDKARSVNADVFGFGHAFYREYYREWTKMEDHWSEIFKTMPVEIEVFTNIMRTGLINKGPVARDH